VQFRTIFHQHKNDIATLMANNNLCIYAAVTAAWEQNAAAAILGMNDEEPKQKKYRHSYATSGLLRIILVKNAGEGRRG
jgi:spore coat polysaccharide biosynthesis predicted glycosyltransferase SpsG